MKYKFKLVAWIEDTCFTKTVEIVASDKESAKTLAEKRVYEVWPEKQQFEKHEVKNVE